MPPAADRHVESWKIIHDLTDDQVLAVVEAEAANARAKGLPPADGPKAFDDGMRRYAAALREPAGASARPARASPDRTHDSVLDRLAAKHRKEA